MLTSQMLDSLGSFVTKHNNESSGCSMLRESAWMKSGWAMCFPLLLRTSKCTSDHWGWNFTCLFIFLVLQCWIFTLSRTVTGKNSCSVFMEIAVKLPWCDSRRTRFLLSTQQMQYTWAVLRNQKRTKLRNFRWLSVNPGMLIGCRRVISCKTKNALYSNGRPGLEGFCPEIQSEQILFCPGRCFSKVLLHHSHGFRLLLYTKFEWKDSD